MTCVLLRFFSVLVVGSFLGCGSSHQHQDKQSQSIKISEVKSFARAAITENNRYPIKPDHFLTPGSLCERANAFRYPEKIKYCNRDVESDEKRLIFAKYDKELGYSTRQMERMDFKIDHLIPLCMGGSNNEDNLWPQHKSVYELTDPIEPVLCELMASGRLKQSDAVTMILEIKNDPASAPDRLEDL